MFKVGLHAWEEAWEHTDYPVFISSVDDEQDGRFHLACRASKNKDGTWNYEYALHNMNSHLAASSFKIPVPIGVNLSPAGFHGVSYHSGDGAGGGVNFDNADWQSAIQGDGSDRGIQWTAVNPSNSNSNALRWGTTYNFRFVADRLPVQVEARIGHYRSDGSVNVLTFGPAQALQSCAGADFDGDGQVRVPDLILLLAAWDSNGSVADLDGDGEVGVPDLVILLDLWGPCQ